MLDLQYRLSKNDTFTTPYVDTYSRQAICMLTMREELCQKVRNPSSHLLISPTSRGSEYSRSGHTFTASMLQQHGFQAVVLT
jgi:hypothetical protein